MHYSNPVQNSVIILLLLSALTIGLIPYASSQQVTVTSTTWSTSTTPVTGTSTITTTAGTTVITGVIPSVVLTIDQYTAFVVYYFAIISIVVTYIVGFIWEKVKSAMIIVFTALAMVIGFCVAFGFSLVLYPILIANVQQSGLILAASAIVAAFSLIFAIRNQFERARMASNAQVLLLIVPLVVNWLVLPQANLALGVLGQVVELGFAAFLYSIIHIVLERKHV